MERTEGIRYGDILLNIDENGDKLLLFVTMTNLHRDKCSGKTYIIGNNRIEYFQNYEVTSEDLPNYVIISPKVMRDAVLDIKSMIGHATSIIKPCRISKKKKDFFKAYFTVTGDAFITRGTIFDDGDVYEDRVIKIGNDYFGDHPTLCEAEIRDSDSFYISEKTYNKVQDMFNHLYKILDEALMKEFWIQVRKFVRNWRELYTETPIEP